MAPMMEPSINYVGLGLVFMTPALGGFLFGYDIGATSFVLSMLRRDIDDNDCWWSEFANNKIEQGLFVSAVSLGALVGSHIVLFHLVRIIGRRAEIRISAVLYIVGTMLNVVSGTLLRNSTQVVGFSCLIFGRLLYGCGVGFTMHGAPTYIVEMCPASVRGAVVTAKETKIVLGIVCGFACGYLLSGDAMLWTDLYGISTLVSIPMLLMTLIIPRSKRWLLLKGRKEEALESMRFVYNGDVRDEFEKLSSQIAAEEHTSNMPFRTASLFGRTHQRAFLASMGLVLLQQFSGQPSILSYTTVLFAAAGLKGESSVATALYMICNSLLTVCMVDRLGRKRLLKSGIFLMMVSLLALTEAFWSFHPDETDNSSYFGPSKKVIILLAMFVYIGAYQIGFGPITWLLVSEVFPMNIRGEAMAFFVELNFLLNFLVQFLFPVIQEKLGWGRTFLGFACVMAFAIYFVHKYVPETKGLTLEEIEYSMQKQPEGIALTEESHLLREKDIPCKDGVFLLVA